MRPSASAFTATLILVSLLTSIFSIQPVRAIGTIYIRADGSIDPPTAPISTLDNVTYTFTGNITSSSNGIVVERDSITIDGNGYILQGNGSGNGFYLSSELLHVTIGNTDIKGFGTGIWAEQYASATISGNRITTCAYGIDARAYSNCVISENIIIACDYGIACGYGSFCNVSGNNISKGLHYGIVAGPYSYVTIAGNNVTDNGFGMSLSTMDSIISENNITGNNGIGITISDSNACNVTRNLIADNTGDGIVLSWWVSDTTVSENTIMTNGGNGIYLCTISHTAKIIDNTILNNHEAGVKTGGEETTASEIAGNTIDGNDYGVWIESPAKIYHNDFRNNTNQAYVAYSTSVWDDGYPSGGNCWSDHHSPDTLGGPLSNRVPGSDGIFDVPYVIDGLNIDYYPLVAPFPSLHDVAIASVIPDDTAVMEGETVHVEVTVANHGHFAETSNVTLYVDSDLTGVASNVLLVAGNSTAIAFSWNTTGYAGGNHTLRAIVNPVPDEVWPNDNELTFEFVWIIQVEIQGVTPSNHVGEPQASFQRGALAYFEIIENVVGESLQQLVTINIFDKENTTIGVAAIQSTVNPGTTTFIISTPIPASASLGNATVYVNSYTDWPHSGGVPYCPEVAGTFEITGELPIQTSTSVQDSYEYSKFPSRTALQPSSAVLDISVETGRLYFPTQQNIWISGNVTYNNQPVAETMVAIEVQDSRSAPVILRCLRTDADGAFCLVFKIPTDGKLGNYTIFVTSNHNGETASRSIGINVVILGDVDGNGIVDIFDIVRMASVYGVSQPNPRYDPNCDLDGDEDIDIFDLTIAAGHYGEHW